MDYWQYATSVFCRMAQINSQQLLKNPFLNNFETAADAEGFCDAQSIHYMDIFAPQALSLLALIFRIFSKAE